MGRILGAVVLGYLVMFVTVFVLLTGGYLALGADRAFRPGTYDVSLLWIGLWLAVGITAGLLGGMVCAAVGRGPRAPMVLSVLVLVLGFLSAAPAFQAPAGAPEVRSGPVPNLEAMMKAREPIWMALLNPVVGFVAVHAGARLRRPSVGS